MPTLNWLSRDKDLKQAAKTPCHLLTEIADLGYGDKNTNNLLIQGDNLKALKAYPFTQDK
jgi:adenine-specific DNA-methyltransferase